MSEKEKKDIFMELLQPFLKDLQRFARAIAKDREEAKDLAQETILRAFHNFDKLKNMDNFKGYVFTIAKNLNSRMQWRKRLFGMFSDIVAENITSNSYNPETAYDVEILYKSMNKLSLKEKEAIALFDISGFSLEEVKEIQGGTLSGVKSRLKRGREKLKEIMTKEYDFNKTEKQTNFSHFINGKSLIESDKILIETSLTAK